MGCAIAGLQPRCGGDIDQNVEQIFYLFKQILVEIPTLGRRIIALVSYFPPV
jgi:hypothetical protein